MTTYQTIKTFGNDRGYSCAFRQWRAQHSHCQLMHGYSLGFEFVLESQILDCNNWCYDYGNFDWIKNFLNDTFDHTVAVAQDDPQLPLLEQLQQAGIAKLVVLPAVGCEKFAEYVFDSVAEKIKKQTDNRVRLVSVKVFEHGANAAVVKK